MTRTIKSGYRSAHANGGSFVLLSGKKIKSGVSRRDGRPLMEERENEEEAGGFEVSREPALHISISTGTGREVFHI